MAPRALLVINHSDSRCESCGGSADPFELAHSTSYSTGPGCGVAYTHMTSDYFGLNEERLKALRPDLEFIDPVAAYRAVTTELRG